MPAPTSACRCLAAAGRGKNDAPHLLPGRIVRIGPVLPPPCAGSGRDYGPCALTSLRPSPPPWGNGIQTRQLPLLLPGRCRRRSGLAPPAPYSSSRGGRHNAAASPTSSPVTPSCMSPILRRSAFPPCTTDAGRYKGAPSACIGAGATSRGWGAEGIARPVKCALKNWRTHASL